MAIQNIRIKYVVDTGDIDKADKSLDKLTASEKELKNEFDKANTSAKKSFDTIKKGADESKNSLNSLDGALSNIGKSIVAFFAVSKVMAFGNEVIKVRGEFQKLELSLGAMIGNKQTVDKLIADSVEFAKKTPFSLTEIGNASKQLLAYGFEANNIISTLKTLGDVSAAVGSNVNDLAYLFGTLRSQGRAFSVDIRQFASRGIPIYEELSKVLGVSVTEVNNLVSAGKVGFPEVEKAFQNMTSEGGKFFNLMEIQSQSLPGQISNLGDSWDSFLDTLGRRSEVVLNKTISLIREAIEGANELLKTDEQKGKEQSSQIQLMNQRYIQQIILEKQAKEFLKGQDSEYIKAFEEGQNQLIQAEFKKHTEQRKNRLKAAEETLRYFKLEVAAEEEITRGKSIAESLSIKARNRELLKEAQAYYDSLTDIKRANSDQEAQSQEDLDKAYKKELQRLSLQESNALRQAKLDGATKELYASLQLDLAKIQDDFNERRIEAFKKFNQQNIDELKAFGLTEIEIARGQVEEMKKLKKLKFEEEIGVKSELELQKETNKEILDEAKNKKSELEQLEHEINEAFKRFYEEDFKNYEDTQNQKKDFAIRVAQEMMAGIGMIYNEFKANADAERQIENDENRIAERRELEAVQGNKQAEANIKAKYDQIERKAKYDQAKANKDQAMFNIGLSTAEAVMRNLAAGPPQGFVLAGLAAAFGAAQLAITANRPLPKFAKGVERLEGEGTETSDSILAKLSKGERVVTAKENKDYFPALHAIHNRHVPPELLNGFVMNYDQIQRPNVVVMGNDNSGLEKKMDTVAKKLDNLKQLNINIDKGGINSFLKTEHSNTELVNNYVSL